MVASLLLIASWIPAHTFVFLSMSENNSVVKPFSADVVASTTLARDAWRHFALWAGALGFLAWVGTGFVALGAIGALPAAILFVFVLLTYYRVLGHLAAGCANALHQRTK